MANLFDNFDRANSTSLGSPSDGGPAWVDAAGGYGISANRVYRSGGGSATTSAVRDAGSSAVEVSGTLAVIGSIGFGLVARQTDDNNMLLLRAYGTSSNGTLILYKRVGGTLSQLGSVVSNALLVGSTFTLRVTAANAITALQDGVVRIGPVTDAFNASATRHGVGSLNGDTGRWDDVGVVDLAVAATTPVGVTGAASFAVATAAALTSTGGYTLLSAAGVTGVGSYAVLGPGAGLTGAGSYAVLGAGGVTSIGGFAVLAAAGITSAGGYPVASAAGVTSAGMYPVLAAAGATGAGSYAVLTAAGLTSGGAYAVLAPGAVGVTGSGGYSVLGAVNVTGAGAYSVNAAVGVDSAARYAVAAAAGITGVGGYLVLPTSLGAGLTGAGGYSVLGVVGVTSVGSYLVRNGDARREVVRLSSPIARQVLLASAITRRVIASSTLHLEAA